MDKISGILPSNARVKSADLSRSQPVRPGAPSIGQPLGTSSAIRDRVSFSAAASAIGKPGIGEVSENELGEVGQFSNDDRTQKPSSGYAKDLQGSRIAESVTKKFFDTGRPDVAAQTQSMNDGEENGPESSFVRPFKEISNRADRQSAYQSQKRMVIPVLIVGPESQTLGASLNPLDQED